MDRLTRGGVPHTEYLLTHAAQNDCEVKCLFQNVDISDPDEEFNTYLNSLLAARDRKKVSIKTKRGIAGGLSRGIYTLGGIMPLGYIRQEDKTICINEEEAEIVRFLFNEVINATPITIISKLIFDKFNVLLQDHNMYRIIKYEKYKGVVTYDDVVYENIIPSIIPTKKWDLAQERYTHCLGYKTNQYTYLFTNKITCQYCGSQLLNRSG